MSPAEEYTQARDTVVKAYESDDAFGSLRIYITSDLTCPVCNKETLTGTVRVKDGKINMYCRTGCFNFIEFADPS